MSELSGGADEGPSESAVTLQRAAGRLKLINIAAVGKKLSPKKADEGGAVAEETAGDILHP